MAGRKVQGSCTGLQMFHLDQCLPKERPGSRWGSAFIWKLRQEIARGGCDITTSDTWLYIQTFGGKTGDNSAWAQ